MQDILDEGTEARGHGRRRVWRHAGWRLVVDLDGRGRPALVSLFRED